MVYGPRGSQVTTPAAAHRTPPAQFTGDGGAASGVTPALRRRWPHSRLLPSAAHPAPAAGRRSGAAGVAARREARPGAPGPAVIAARPPRARAGSFLPARWLARAPRPGAGTSAQPDWLPGRSGPLRPRPHWASAAASGTSKRALPALRQSLAPPRRSVLSAAGQRGALTERRPLRPTAQPTDVLWLRLSSG